MDVLEQNEWLPRAPELSGLVASHYTLDSLKALESVLSPALAIELNPLGRVCASSRQTEGADPTHYDAVWVRDSVWAYWGLRKGGKQTPESERVLRGLADYFGSDTQLSRQADIIREPALVVAADGAMQVVHIRFDGRSESFEDVQVNGADQVWNHKQHDAVALVAIAVAEALESGEWKPEDLSAGAWSFFLRLPTYWDRLDFANCEDAGAWEEIERVNSSSIGLVTASLEKWQALSQLETWGEVFLRKASEFKLDVDSESLFNERIGMLIETGYVRLGKQLPHESPEYPIQSAKCRSSDAALLNLIYPCSLKKMSDLERARLLDKVGDLIRPVGVLRYHGDAYQSAGYWNTSQDLTHDTRTDDHSTESSFGARANRFVPDTEAQWFFDSWFSQCFGILYARVGDEEFFLRQVAHFNRALCQLTGPNETGADGMPVPAFALPESYNTVLTDQGRQLLPSPITPLNWSKACLKLSIEALRASIELRNR